MSGHEHGPNCSGCLMLTYVQRAESAEALVALLSSQVRDLVSAAEHPFKGPHDTDATMLLEAATRLDTGHEPGGSHTKQTIARVLRAVSTILLSTPPVGTPIGQDTFGDGVS